MNKNHFGHRRNNPQKTQNSTPQPTSPKINFRNTTTFKNKINYEVQPSPNQYRYSFDTKIRRNALKKIEEAQGQQKNNSYDNIRNTLAELKKKIQNAKQKLQGNYILDKNMILQEPEHEEFKNIELISFNSSSNSNITSSLNQTKRSFLKQLRKNDLNQSQIKGYYKREIVKALRQRNQVTIYHIQSNWRVLCSCRVIPQPSKQILNKRKIYTSYEQTNRRAIVFGLDGTLVHVDWQRKSQEDIDVVLNLQGNFKKRAYLCLRPYVMTFLKKMSKHFEIIIFSDLSQSQTDAILQILDPFKQIIKTRLCRQHCIQLQRGFTTKDLRVLNRDLTQILLVDNQLYNSIYQIDNAVPILPFYRGNDVQLYSLEKYLLQAARSSDLRKFNKSYFKLFRYCEFNDGLWAVKNLYLLQK